VLGAVAATAVVVGATGAGQTTEVVLPDGPFGLWRHASQGRGVLAALATVGLCALVAAAAWLYRLAAAEHMLRVLAVLGVIATAALTVRLARAERRATALVLVAANPIVIVHLVGGAHLDALLAGLGVLTLLAVRRRWWLLAAAAAATALAVKLPGLVLIGYVLVARLRAGQRRVTGATGLALVVLAMTVGYAALVPNGWGWVSALDVPGRIQHPWDLSTMLSWLLHTSLPVRVATAVAAARGMSALIAGLVVLALLWRAAAASRSRRAAALVGAGLLALAMAAPAVHAWYLAWGLAPVAAGATARGHRYALVLCAALTFTAVPDRLAHHVLGLCLVAGALCVAVLAVAPWRTGDRRVNVEVV